jgi:hypothetical protein
MNKAVYIAIGSAIGAALGTFITYIVLEKQYDVVFEHETQSYRDEIDKLRDENGTLNKRLVNKLGKEKAKFFEEEHVSDSVPNELLNNDISEEDDDSYDIEPTKKEGSIRFISKKDYEDDDDFEKETFEYYMGNGVIIQDNDILESEEFEEVCGNAVLPLLRKDKSLSRWSSAGDNEIYIRNEQYNTDYRIKRHHSSFDD